MELWNERQKRYHKMLSKYLRYVFNDHFMIAILFLLGALSLNYASFLKTQTLKASWASLLVLIIMFISLQLGKLATLTKPADIVFLLPKEDQLSSYLLKAFKRSALLNCVMQFIVMLVLVPFLIIVLDFSQLEIIFLISLQVGLKCGELYFQMLNLYLTNTKQLRVFKYGFELLSLASCLIFMPQLSVIWLIALCLLSIYLTQKLKKLSWTKMLELENKRLNQLYRFFNLFTDVSYVKTKARRRKYLDFLMPKSFKSSTYTYLFWRGFFRSNQYLGLDIRLTVLGSIILIFLNDIKFALFFALIFIYLIGFQMLPMYFKYDENVFMHLYPLTAKVKLKEIGRAHV